MSGCPGADLISAARCQRCCQDHRMQIRAGLPTLRGLPLTPAPSPPEAVGEGRKSGARKRKHDPWCADVFGAVRESFRRALPDKQQIRTNTWPLCCPDPPRSISPPRGSRGSWRRSRVDAGSSLHVVGKFPAGGVIRVMPREMTAANALENADSWPKRSTRRYWSN